MMHHQKKSLLLGQLSKAWVPLQDEYYASFGSKKTGRTWATGLVVQLWQLLWSHWQHRNNINNNTMHPDKLQAIELLGNCIQDDDETGFAEYMRPNMLRTYDAKSKLQWLELVDHARRRAKNSQAMARGALHREQQFFETWLGTV
jgi:hypothetical protein